MIKGILKFAFAIGLVYWLIHQGKLDFSLLGKLAQHKWVWAGGFALLIFQNFIATYRWKTIVEIGLARKLPYFPMLRLNWIGLLFNTILPGAVTGDLIKALYARDLDKNMGRTFLVTTVAIDRVIGLMGLLFITGLFSIYSYQDINRFGPQVKYLVHINFLLFSGMVGFVLTLFMKAKYQSFFLNLAKKVPVIGNMVEKTLTQLWLIGSNKKSVITGIILSIFAQIVNITTFWMICSLFITGDFPITYALAFIPLGLMVMAVPITPAGMGVGHAAFGTLFSYFGIDNGASLFNLYFITVVLVNLAGIFPYLLSGRRHTLKEAQLIEEAQ